MGSLLFFNQINIFSATQLPNRTKHFIPMHDGFTGSFMMLQYICVQSIA